MKQFKKLLSVLLAIIMVLSSVSVLASAFGTAWRDEAIVGQYNSIDVPTLTTEQYATAALDEVDRMLGAEDEEDMILTEEDIFVGTLNLTSVNSTLDSINTILNGSLWNNYKSLLADLANLNISALTARRSNGGSDVAVINSLLKFLYDNKDLLSGFVKGNIDLGSIVAQFVDLSDFEVPGLLKGMLYEAVYDEDAPDQITQTVDTMAQDLINKLVVTGYGDDEPLLPALEGYTNISSGSMLTFVDNILKVLYNEYLVPRANELWIDDINEMLAENPEEVEKYSSYFNLTAEGTCNFTFQEFDFDDDKLVLEELNNILGSIINLALSPDLDFCWELGDNSKIVDNIIAIGREVLAATGSELFASYVEIKTVAELDEMTDMEVVAYVVRTILNSSIDGINIPNTADNMVKVGSYLVKGLMATELPERDYSSETAYPVNDVNTIYTILADFGIKALNENPGLNLNYGIGIDALATAAANWAITKYGGLLSGVQLPTTNTGWANLDTLLFKIANRNWFNKELFPNQTVTAESLVKDVLIGNILNLDFENLIALLTNKSADSDFVTKTPKQFIIDLAARLVNVIFPGAIKTNMTTLDEIISANNLGDTVDALFSDLYNYRDTLVPAVLPIVTDILDLTSSQEFKTPSFDIEDFYYYSTGTANTSFDITNRSYGVNTGYTDNNGVFHQDSRFGIQLVDITAVGTVAGTTTTKTFTITMPTQTLIAGGETVTVGLKGAFTGTTDTVVTIKYNIIKEDGTALTSDPLEARIYTCFSTTNTDETTEWTSTTGNYRANGGVKNIYSTSAKALDDAEFKIKNTTTSDVSMVGYAANQAAAASMTSLSYVGVNTEARTILAKGQGTYQPLVIDDEAYNLDKEASQLAAFTEAGYKKYSQTIGVTVGSTNVTTLVTINLYKDYGLNGLFNNEVNAQRQRSDYDSAAFDTYLAAMADAAKLVKSKKNANQFSLTTAVGMAYKYEGVAETLANAILALEETATGGVTALRARLDAIEPSNEGKDFMVDGDYSFFGAANYLTYTWSNYRDAQKDANRFASKYEEGGEYDPAGENPQKPTALDVAMKTWELNNYYARLRSVAGSKVNLALAINAANAANYDGTLYTEESFGRYEDALAFASSVNNESGALQVKINMAYVELIEAQKRLITDDGEEGGDVVVVAAGENPYNSNYAPVLIENCDEETLIYGIAPESEIDDVSLYFTAESGSLDGVTFECNKIATGSKITAYNANGDVIGEYIIVIKGDVNGDGAIKSTDSSNITRALAGLVELSTSGESAKDYAADVNCDGSVKSTDVSNISRSLAGLVEIDFASHKF